MRIIFRAYTSDLLTPKAQINNRTLRSSEDGSLAQPKARLHSIQVLLLSPVQNFGTASLQL